MIPNLTMVSRILKLSRPNLAPSRSLYPRASSYAPRLIHPAWKSRQCQPFSSSTAQLEDPKPTIPLPPPNFDEPDIDLNSHTSLPRTFGTNQHMHVDEALKDWLRSLLWQFRAPVRYAFAYGSGVFSQGAGMSGKKPMVDLIFGVTYTQHWHSLNLSQHRDHYSFLGALGSGAVSYVQDNIGAGVYFNPYVEINGTMVKYGVVNIDTLCHDLSEWDTLYLAGRLQKPVKILRDDPRVRLANQINLLSAVRVALLLLPEKFTEYQLYTTIAGISYMGDPRMRLYAENPNKVQNIVDNQLSNFRRLYSPLIDQLPNVRFVKDSLEWNDAATDTELVQDMNPVKRGNMVRRLPKSFREKLYFQYQRKYAIPALEFEKMIGKTEDEERMQKKQGGEFEQRIVKGGEDEIRKEVSSVIKSTIGWPSATQSTKGVLTAGVGKSVKYLGEKIGKWKNARKAAGETDK